MTAADIEQLWTPGHKWSVSGLAGSLLRDGAIAMGRKFGYSVAKSSTLGMLLKVISLSESYKLVLLPLGVAPSATLAIGVGLRYAVSREVNISSLRF